MGIKNTFKKSNLLKKESFYVILFVCLCIIAVVAVYISKTNALNDQKQLAEKPSVQVEEKKLDDAEQVKNQEQTVPTMNKTNPENKEEKEESKDTTAKKPFTIAMPVKGDVSKNFDKNNLTESKTMGQWETHEGMDIACDLGSEVKAAANGKVVDVYNDDKVEANMKSGYGLTVVLEHDGGYKTVYSNLADNLKVKKGDTVKTGAVIGVVGDTSVRESVKVEGSHLHFTVLEKTNKDYVTVDPSKFIKK